MAQFNGLPLSLLTIILLLAPGLIGLRLLFLFSGKKFDLTRTRLIVYSSSLSCFSVLILYFFSPVLFLVVARPARWLAQTLHLATTQQIISISLPEAIGFYLTHVLITLFAGVLVGSLYKEYKFNQENELPDRREPWEYIFTNSPKSGERIEVRLASGENIQGEFNKRAFDADRRELFLDDPYSVAYDLNTQDPQREDLGRSIYIHCDAIQYVVTLEEDPNASITEILKNSDYMGEIVDEVQSNLSDLTEKMDDWEVNRVNEEWPTMEEENEDA